MWWNTLINSVELRVNNKYLQVHYFQQPPDLCYLNRADKLIGHADSMKRFCTVLQSSLYKQGLLGLVMFWRDSVCQPSRYLLPPAVQQVHCVHWVNCITSTFNQSTAQQHRIMMLQWQMGGESAAHYILKPTLITGWDTFPCIICPRVLHQRLSKH